MTSSKAYWIYWSACFATVITWVFAVSAAASEAWISLNGTTMVKIAASCVNLDDSICHPYHAATAFQIMATVVVSYALVATAFASFSSPPKTRVLGLVLGIMLAEFSLFQMIAFSCMAAVVAELNSLSFDDVKAGPTLGVAVMAWLLGLAGSIIILVLRTSATNDDEGPFRKCISGIRGSAGGASAGPRVETV